MIRKKALLVGNYTHPKFHPLQGVDREITHTLQDHFSVQCTENQQMLEPGNITGYDLCISYIENWSDKLSLRETSGLLSFVSQGGGLLVLHQGIGIQDRYEVAQLMGAKFTGHPSRRQLSLRVSAPEHDILQGIEPFEIDEEPYRFEFDPFTEKTILMEYEEEGELHPAAWAHAYGLGRIVYLMPGHDEGSFKHPEYRKLVLQAAKWAGHYPG
ncbi:ThuA domain-containing protein [Paenibacillus sp. CAA11]|uniref:ThuA domain-containing protein n=1 Tax=Paenibacillus sp. CAA11 TaxID=1532905 RepID=UPI000D38B6C2|nr:ThuA domain-containing protein [Paenibacillus sp. CAA11]AWB47074.1 ThuA domain-containing protein [Paenibacillus sp. CAA11]